MTTQEQINILTVLASILATSQDPKTLEAVNQKIQSIVKNF